MFVLFGIAATVLCTTGGSAGDEPVAAWEFNTSEKIEGRVHGAKQIPCGDGSVLAFEETGAYVDCGNAPELDMRGALSLEVWAYPRARARSETGIAGKSFDSYGMTIYGDGHYYWYISSGANKCKTPAPERQWTQLVGTFDGETLKLYANGELKDTFQSMFDKANAGGKFSIGRITREGGGSAPTDSFAGAIGAVRLYNRALDEDEIRSRYENEKDKYRRIEQGMDRLTLTSYYYFADNKMYVDIGFGNFCPLQENERAVLSLSVKGAAQPLQETAIATVPESGIARDIEFSLDGLTPGEEYEIRAAVMDETGVKAEVRETFRDAPEEIALPSPDERIVPALVPVSDSVPYELEVSENGGFRIDLSGQTYGVDSLYSYPHGGENALGVSSSDGEAAWKVSVAQEDDGTYTVNAQGAHYTIRRRILRRPNHVLVKDTLTNISGAPLGIMLRNQIDAPGKDGVSSILHPNPTVFFSTERCGIGLVALDDVYLEHHESFLDGAVGGLRDSKFALDTGAAYTLEWAVYMNDTGDYYDFINAIRKDEGLIRTVEGSFAFIKREEAPSPEFVKQRALKYASVPCLSWTTDDKGLSVEGIEFTEYPKECAVLKETFAETRRRYPDMQTMFHIAHSLYATDKPDELFPDSRTLNAAGKQTDYGDNNLEYYKRYFSEEHVDEGYRWFIFYPAADNRFGQAMLDATDFMLDEIGVTGMFADGLTHGYGGRFTYDRWDGHTAEIDPETKTIKRTYASVNLLADPILIEVVRKINRRGGVVIANSYPGTRTFHKEDVIYCIETGSGDKSCAHLHLAPTVVALGDPGRIKCDRDVYDDIRAKLEWGALYFFYSEGELTRETVVSRMYPITVEAIHAGTVTGRERIITARSGTYGWPGERDLHVAYRYDGRGIEVPHGFVTTAGPDGVRTDVALDTNETAVLEKIPLSMETKAAVNLRVIEYGPEKIKIELSGKGPVELTVRDGVFRMRKDAEYIVEGTPGPMIKKLRRDDEESLTLLWDLDGAITLTLTPAGAAPPERKISL